MNRHPQEPKHPPVTLDTQAAWRRALPHALWVTALILTLFYFWFAIANRYVIFLYGHLGAGPFDAVTRSRYWMAGLVAAAIVLVIATGLTWMQGRSAARRGRPYRPPDWWRIWVLCTLPLAVGIPWITMRLNWPTLPAELAAACVAATLIGLAIALAQATAMVQPLRQLGATLLYALGIVPSLLLILAIERVALIGAAAAYTVAAAAPLLGDLWIRLLRRRRIPPPTPIELALAVLSISYLILPLSHYLFFTPPEYRYITTATNFFAEDGRVQLLSFGVAGVLIAAATRSMPGTRRP